MGLVQTLIDCDQEYAEPALPQGLRKLYDGDLHFRRSPAARPFVIANFVSTLDGVVSYEIKGQAEGSAISGSDPADRFIMGLLRASADGIIVGRPNRPRRKPERPLDSRIHLPRCEAFVHGVSVKRTAPIGIPPPRDR
jgi:hypothetical protein